MKIFVKAKPNSRVESIKKLSETNLEVCIKEPPMRGQANVAIIEALAKHFNVGISKVRLVSGRASRNKIFEIL